MATSATHCLMIATVAVLGILLLGGENYVSADLVECRNLEGLGVLIGCLRFIEKDGPKVSPSNDCCNLVKFVGMPCTCKLVTKEIEETISMEKLVFVAQSCGKPIERGTKCGSYKVPPA